MMQISRTQSMLSSLLSRWHHVDCSPASSFAKLRSCAECAEVSIPPLTKDKRVQYVKLAKDYSEKTKAPALQGLKGSGLRA
eukprot:Skav234537  [mRNA]  locus=scaffold2556:184327:184569:- [translate_table: standard]